jgi:hypothetical protein
MDDRRVELQIWRFVRGDLPPRAFESWLCKNTYIEQYLGADLYLAAISIDFRDVDAVGRLKATLGVFASATWPLGCGCVQLSDLAVVDMGEEQVAYFDTIDELKRRGDPLWWLWVGCCRLCSQAWLVAQCCFSQ